MLIYKVAAALYAGRLFNQNKDSGSMTQKLTNVYDAASAEKIQTEAEVCDAIVRAAEIEGGKDAKIGDASETLVFARQLETIKSTIYRKKYPELKGKSFVPMSTEGGADSEYITYRVWDSYVMAVVMSDYQTEFPLVSASAFEVTMKYYDLIDGYQVSVRDLRRAAKANVDITGEYGMAARRGIELAIDEVYAVGCPSLKTYGLVNNPNVSLQSLTTGNWPAATGEQILTDLNLLVNSMRNNTLEIWEGDTLLMSTLCYGLISTKLLNSANGSNITVLNAFKAQHPEIFVSSWTKLNTAAASGTTGRMIFYKRDPSVLEFEMGKEFEIHAPDQRGFILTTACTATVAGVALHSPAAVMYVDAQLI